MRARADTKGLESLIKGTEALSAAMRRTGAAFDEANADARKLAQVYGQLSQEEKEQVTSAARLAAAIQDEKDATVEQALDNMRERRAANALLLSEQMGGGLYSALLGEVLTDGDRDGIPDLYERKTNVGPRTVPSDRPRLTADQPLTEVDIIEFLAAHPELLALARPVDGVGRNTYTSDQPPAATPGQGERPNGPPARQYGGDTRP